MIPNSIIREIVLSADLDAVGITRTDSRRENKQKSIISAAECYLTDETPGAVLPDNPHGAIARYTWRNYYKDVRLKLKKAVNILKSRFGSNHIFKYYSCAPYSIVNEKQIAAKCGLGYYGKNGIIRTKDYGSWIVLGEIITSLEIEPDIPSSENCGTCSVCIDTCPAKAITKPYVVE